MVDETGSRGKDAAYFKEGDEDMIYESAQDRYQDYEDNKKAVSPFRIGEIAPFVPFITRPILPRKHDKFV